jgi:hypothetical protein
MRVAQERDQIFFAAPCHQEVDRLQQFKQMWYQCSSAA